MKHNAHQEEVQRYDYSSVEEPHDKNGCDPNDSDAISDRRQHFGRCIRAK
jgi:hypothetical protein